MRGCRRAGLFHWDWRGDRRFHWHGGGDGVFHWVRRGDGVGVCINWEICRSRNFRRFLKWHWRVDAVVKASTTETSTICRTSTAVLWLRGPWGWGGNGGRLRLGKIGKKCFIVYLPPRLCVCLWFFAFHKKNSKWKKSSTVYEYREWQKCTIFTIFLIYYS